MIDPESLTVTLLLGLATARITALIVLDDLLEPLRHRLFIWSPPPDRDGEYPYLTPERPRPRFAGRLLSCYHCIGVWVAAIIAISYMMIPGVTIGLAFVAAIAQISDLTLRWSR